MLLLLVRWMLQVLVVLEYLVVFVGGLFERVNVIESEEKFLGAKKKEKSSRQSQKSTFTLELYIALFPFMLHC